MNAFSFQRAYGFLGKTPAQKQITARFFSTMWLAKLPYAPHKVRLSI
jgi:hypothetical protein